MADKEVVVKIPEEMYNWIYDANKNLDDYNASDFWELIKNGTPLPKELRVEIEKQDKEQEKWLISASCDRVNCEKTKCNDCIKHNYCDYELLILRK